VLDTENGIQYVTMTENTFLNTSSISVQHVFIFVSGYGQWKDHPTIP